PSGDAQRQLLDRVEKARPCPHDRPGEFEAAHSRDQHLEDGPQLDAGQGRAEAEVRTEAETEMMVRAPPDVEAVRAFEDCLVAVGRAVQQRHLVPGPDQLTVELHGQLIWAGDKVALLYSSANRDE